MHMYLCEGVLCVSVVIMYTRTTGYLLLGYNEKKKKLHGINMQWYWSTVRNMPQNVSTLCNCSVGQNYSNCCLASLKG